MNNKHKKTLKAICTEPPSPNIRWNDIEALFIHLGAEISEGRGSRVRVRLHNISIVFHRPHPRPTTDKGALASVRVFLQMAGVL